MFLKSSKHFTGEVHWFISLGSGIPIPEALKDMASSHVYKYGANEPIVEEKATGIVATPGYEAFIHVLSGKKSAPTPVAV